MDPILKLLENEVEFQDPEPIPGDREKIMGIFPPRGASHISSPMPPREHNDAIVPAVWISRLSKHSPSQLEPAPSSFLAEINTHYL